MKKEKRNAPENTSMTLRRREEAARQKIGLRFALVSLFLNLFLAGLKFFLGLFLGILSLEADGLNNFSDALTSAVSLISFRLAGKPADEEHPYGHGRSEYLGAILIAYLIFSVAWEIFSRALERIQTRELFRFPPVFLYLLLFSMAAKGCLCRAAARAAKRTESPILSALSLDSLSDILTDALLVLVFVLQMTGHFRDVLIYFDAAAGSLLAVLIAVNGYRLLSSTIRQLLGRRLPEEKLRELENLISAVPGVLGFHDLYVHEYGPGRIYASVHLEVDGKLDLMVAHDISDHVERKVAKYSGISLVTHLDPRDFTAVEEREAERRASERLREIYPDLELHDFRLLRGKGCRNLCFDLRLDARSPLSEREVGENVRRYFAEKDPKDNVVLCVERANVGISVGEMKLGEKEE